MPRLSKRVCEQNADHSRAKHSNGETRENVLTDNQFQRIHLLVHASMKLCSSQHALNAVASALLTKLHLHYSMIDGLPRYLPPKHVQLPM